MLINELKQELKEYDKKQLEKIIVELYKRIPTKTKEEYDIDNFIKNVGKKEKIEKKEVPFEQLAKEIDYFIQCVDSELYVVPNRIIPKKERTNWRFKVKRYYKELSKINPETKEGIIATELLIRLFTRLSVGEERLLFTNWNTFRAISIEQSAFYDMIVKRILILGYTKENLNKCIKLFAIPRSPNEYSYNMHSVFINNLKTSINKEMTIELLKEQVVKQKNDLIKEKNHNNKYYISEDLNRNVFCISDIYLILTENEEGIKYFLENFIEKDEESKYVILLDLLEDYNLTKKWIEIYEKQQHKLEFRERIVLKYRSLKNEN